MKNVVMSLSFMKDVHVAVISVHFKDVERPSSPCIFGRVMIGDEMLITVNINH